jgi:hypothetical protein
MSATGTIADTHPLTVSATCVGSWLDVTSQFQNAPEFLNMMMVEWCDL